MENKKNIIDSSLKSFYDDLNLLLYNRLSGVYDTVMEKCDVKINQLIQINNNLKSEISSLRKENDYIKNAQQSYINEINKMKNDGDLYLFISNKLYPRLFYLNKRLKALKDSSNVNNEELLLFEELNNFYKSMFQMMETSDMTFYESKIGQKIDYNIHEIIKTIPTNDENENEVIINSLMPGILFKNGKCIKEKVEVKIFVEDN